MKLTGALFFCCFSLFTKLFSAEFVESTYDSGKPRVVFVGEKGPDQRKLSGVLKRYFETGGVQEVVGIVNDQKDGEMRSYYDSGKPETLWQYRDGKKEGYAVGWFPNGGIEFNCKRPRSSTSQD